MKKQAKIIFIVLNIAIMVGLFIFSSQTSQESSKLSSYLSEQILEKTKQLDKLEYSERISLIKKTESVLRSLAHIIMYFFLAFTASYVHLLSRRKNWYLLALGQSFLFAVFDEYHQGSFVKGRAFEYEDIAKDMIGAVLAVIIIFIIIAIDKKIKRQRELRIYRSN